MANEPRFKVWAVVAKRATGWMADGREMDEWQRACREAPLNSRLVLEVPAVEVKEYIALDDILGLRPTKLPEIDKVALAAGLSGLPRRKFRTEDEVKP